MDKDNIEYQIVTEDGNIIKKRMTEKQAVFETLVGTDISLSPWSKLLIAENRINKNIHDI